MKKTVGEEMIASIQDFIYRLKRGESVDVDVLKHEDTPDGPMHTVERKKMTLKDLQERKDE